MIKEIRIGMDCLLHNKLTVMQILKQKGFPVEGILELKPKAGLVYYEFHDHRTGEIVIQWEQE